MKLSMSNIAWTYQERIDAYAMMAKAGFRGLEIAPGLFFNASDDPFVPSKHDAREALAEIEDHDLSLVSMQSLLFGVQGAGLFNGEEARSALSKGMERAIDLAGRFGIPNLVFGSPAQRRVPDGMEIARAHDEAARVFRVFGERAMQAGTCITVEANPKAYGTNFLNTLEEAADFVRKVDHSAIKVILDLGAMHMNASFDSVPGEIENLSAALNHVHVSEPDLAPAPASPETLVPVLKELSHAGYSRAVSIEMRRDDSGLEAVKTSIDALASAAKAAGLSGEHVHA